MIVFVIGRSGAGKSTATRYLCALAAQQQRSATRIDIYDYAYALFQQDTEHKHFIPHPHDEGFDAIDTEALFSQCRAELERRVAASQAEFTFVEYSCADYTINLPLFSFFSRASILLLDAPLELCKKRIRERIAHPQSPDDHTTLSEPRFSAYFSQQNIAGLTIAMTIDATQEKVLVQKELERFYGKSTTN